jgi:hypothetical protein
MIGGVLALVAGVVAYFGAMRAANRQVAALRRRDRLQARGLAVAVYPELLEIQVAVDRTRNILAKNFPAVAGGIKLSILQVIESAKIDLPPMLARNADNFFVVEPGAASLIQVVSFTLQYDSLVDTPKKQIDEDPSKFDPAGHQRDLSGHLSAISNAVSDAQSEIAPLHDEATAASGQTPRSGFFQRWLPTRLLMVLGLVTMLIGAGFGTYGVWVSEDQAIERGVSRWSGGTREDQLKLPAVQNLLSQSHNAMLGFILIGIGTLLQIAGTVSERLTR